jgi:hypothetical protein
MNIKDRIKKSIKKWEDIVNETGTDSGGDNCELCKKYWNKARMCFGCPVYKKTGEALCNSTPYSKWINHQFFSHKNQYKVAFYVQCPECKEIAQKEVDFLKSLLGD